MSIESALNQVVQQAQAAQSVAPDDYKDPKTGILMCGKCHTPKQYHFHNAAFDLGLVPVMCDCQRAAHDAEQQKRRESEREMLTARRKAACFGANDRKAAYTFDTDDRANTAATNAAQGYVRHFTEMREKGRGLFFIGPCGTGKTFLACCIANALLDKGYTVKVSTFADIANRLQGTFDKESIYDDLNAVDLLILDDLNAERDTSFMQEIVFTVIDNRCAAQKPLIVTSNITPSEFANPDTIERRRVFSRLQEVCIPVEVNGKDRRREAMMKSCRDDLAFLNT